MSFMVVSGKTFICHECSHRMSVEYEGGALMTQIGDFEVMRQQEIAEELGERSSYLYDFGLCESCYIETVSKTSRERNNKLRELLERLDVLYSASGEEISALFPEVMEYVKKDFSLYDVNKAVGGLEDDFFEDKRQHKGKRRSPLKTFWHNYEEVLEGYILKQI